MYVSSLLLSKAKKDWFQLDRLGAAFQRKQGTDFTVLYSMYKSQTEAKSRSWQALSTQGRNWLQEMFLWVKYIYLRGLKKYCFPVKIKQPACSSPIPSWPTLQPKKKMLQGLFLSEDPVIALSPRFCVTFCLCLCRSPAPSLAGTQRSLPLPPSLALLFPQACVIQPLWEFKNVLPWFWRLGTTREPCYL